MLENIKADPSLRQIPLIVLTTSDVEADVIRCYELQANCYIHKPKNWDMFHRMIRSINDFWLTEVTLLRRDNAALLAQSSTAAALRVEH